MTPAKADMPVMPKIAPMAVPHFRAVEAIPVGYAMDIGVDSKEGGRVTTWEYATTPLIIHNTTAILNQWGEGGWELVQIVTGPEGGLVAYFKRPIGDN